MIAKRADATRLRDMLHAVDALIRLRPESAAAITDDEDRLMLLVHYLEILGEAASAISPVTQSLGDDVPWGLMISTRNRLAHGYFEIDVETVFATVVKDVPGVREPLVRLLSRIGNSPAPID